ncbi:MAG: hypothetical protein QXP36_02830 [Conexivisphaerales archaeon]
MLRAYIEKNAVEKEFSHFKPHLEPFFSTSDNGSKARLFLAISGYTLAAVIASR